MAESATCGPTMYYVKDDFFRMFRLQPEKVIAHGMCGRIVLTNIPDKNDAKCVVKMFCLQNEENSAKSRRHFNAEMKYMQSFDHPHIMKCIIAVECPKYLAISMHHYQRGTFCRYVGGLSIQLSEQYVTQIACALRYLHRHNVVHMDVKLANIFMNNDCNAILGDFGLAMELLPEQKSVSRKLCGGTRGYLAPEHTGTATQIVDPYKLDSFCRGVVLWALVVEKKPAINIDYYLDVTGRQDLPLGIRSWLLNLLERNPSTRLTVTDMLSMIRQTSDYSYIIDNF